MPKPFAAFDVDGTIFKSSLTEKVVEACIAASLFDAAVFNDVYSNRQRWQVTNNEGLYQAYLHRLVGVFVQQMAGIPVDRFEHVTASMIREQTIRKFAFPRRVMETLTDSHHLIAISGSPLVLVAPFLQDLPVRMFYGSQFEIEDGMYTGIAQNVGEKAQLLRGLVASGDIAQEGSIAIGDTINDASMLAYAGLQVMFNASATLTDHGRAQGWARVNEVKDQITTLVFDPNLGQYIEQDTKEFIENLRDI